MPIQAGLTSEAALVETVANAVCSLLPGHGEPIPLHEPLLDGGEEAWLKSCLESGFVSSVGPYVKRFADRLAERLDVPHVIPTSSGTAALHAALLAIGVGPGDEVLMPALSFVATANAVAYTGAIPHFVDIAWDNLGMDATPLETYLREMARPAGRGFVNRHSGRRLAALLPMHTFGHPVDLDPLLELAERYVMPLVEDAAESLGSLYKGRPTGGIGLIGALSFNGNKIVTTGGGGALATRDETLARAASHLTTTAKLPHRWELEHDRVGYNYRMPNLNASLGLAQLERLDEFVARKRALAGRYAEAFQGLPGVRFLTEPDHCRSNYWLNAVLLVPPQAEGDPDHAARLRDSLLAALHDRGIQARPAWKLLCDLPMYQTSPRMDLPTARRVRACLVNLPSSPGLHPWGRAVQEYS